VLLDDAGQVSATWIGGRQRSELPALVA